MAEKSILTHFEKKNVVFQIYRVLQILRGQIYIFIQGKLSNITFHKDFLTEKCEKLTRIGRGTASAGAAGTGTLAGFRFTFRLVTGPKWAPLPGFCFLHRNCSALLEQILYSKRVRHQNQLFNFNIRMPEQMVFHLRGDRPHLESIGERQKLRGGLVWKIVFLTI